jgi:hypothetical protein
MAPRPAVPLREIVYTLSPYNQEIVMQGVAKLPGKIAKFFNNVRAAGGGGSVDSCSCSGTSCGTSTTKQAAAAAHTPTCCWRLDMHTHPHRTGRA